MQFIFICLLILIELCSASCQVNCYVCKDSNITECEICNTGYYITKTGECDQCQDGCLECTSPSSCSMCTHGYFLIRGFCQQCWSPCHECISHSSCTSCVSGYYLYNRNCYTCPSQCLTCTSSSSCISCTSGYFLKNGSCAQCQDMCLSCSNTNDACTSCPARHYLLDGTCSRCVSFCKLCKGTPYTCTECEGPYYGQNCLFRCDEQYSGYICDLMSGKCINGCNDGYYQQSNRCYSCSINCTACQDGRTCNVCDDGHYLQTLEDGSVVCLPCDDTCVACVLSQCFRQERSPNGYMASDTVTGIAIGTFCVGLVAGIVALLALRIFLKTRKPGTQTRDHWTRNIENNVPRVAYINTSNLDNTNEVADSPFSYETLSDRVDDRRHYSTLTDAL